MELKFTVPSGGTGNVPPHQHPIADVSGLREELEAIESALVSNPVAGATPGITLWIGAQAAYDAIAAKDNNTLYFITEGA